MYNLDCILLHSITYLCFGWRVLVIPEIDPIWEQIIPLLGEILISTIYQLHQLRHHLFVRDVIHVTLAIDSLKKQDGIEWTGDWNKMVYDNK